MSPKSIYVYGGDRGGKMLKSIEKHDLKSNDDNFKTIQIINKDLLMSKTNYTFVHQNEILICNGKSVLVALNPEYDYAYKTDHIVMSDSYSYSNRFEGQVIKN